MEANDGEGGAIENVIQIIESQQGKPFKPWLLEARAELTALREENARLREALDGIIGLAEDGLDKRGSECMCYDPCTCGAASGRRALDVARAALSAPAPAGAFPLDEHGCFLRVRGGYISVGDDVFTSVDICRGAECLWRSPDVVRKVEDPPLSDLEYLAAAIRALDHNKPAGVCVTLKQLREIEYNGADGETLESTCPACGERRDKQGHAPDCWLAAAIKVAGG